MVKSSNLTKSPSVNKYDTLQKKNLQWQNGNERLKNLCHTICYIMQNTKAVYAYVCVCVRGIHLY